MYRAGSVSANWFSTSTWTAPAARHNCVAAVGLNVAAAGDTIFYSSDHAESQTAPSLSIATVGTATAPSRYLSVNRTSNSGSAPWPTTLTAGASLSGSQSVGLTWGSGTVGYWYGVSVTIGSGGTGGSFTVASGTYDTCSFIQAGSTSGNGTLMDGAIILKNCTFSFAETGQSINIAASAGSFSWENTSGTAALAGTTPTALFNFNTAGARSVVVRGLDISAVSGTVLSAAASNTIGSFKMINCKTNASATLFTSSNLQSLTDTEMSFEAINCSNGTNYTHYWMKRSGTVATNTTYVRSSGATDGTQAVSHALTTPNPGNCCVRLTR